MILFHLISDLKEQSVSRTRRRMSAPFNPSGLRSLGVGPSLSSELPPANASVQARGAQSSMETPEQQIAQTRFVPTSEPSLTDPALVTPLSTQGQVEAIDYRRLAGTEKRAATQGREKGKASAAPNATAPAPSAAPSAAIPP